MSVQEAIRTRSLDDFADRLAPDVVWVGLWPGQLCRNRDDVLEMFARMREQEIRVSPAIVLERDDVLVVDPRMDDGRHHVLVLSDDLVSEVRVYPDRRSALDAVDGRPW